MRCAPRAARVASAPQAADRRPPRGHPGPRCPRSPSLPPLSIAAASLHLPQEISRAYGPEACKLLPINSRAAGAPPLPDLWTGARPPEINPSADAPPPPTEELGALLSDADMEQARTPAPEPDPGPRRYFLQIHAPTSQYPCAMQPNFLVLMCLRPPSLRMHTIRQIVPRRGLLCYLELEQPDVR